MDFDQKNHAKKIDNGTHWVSFITLLGEERRFKMDRYEKTLTRLLNELRFAISKRNAHNKLNEASASFGWGFFGYSTLAFFNDMVSHAIKVLDEHRGSVSFWYIYKANQKVANKALQEARLEVSKLRELSTALKLIRDKTHFHIDRDRVFNPSEVWKEANISGDQFNCTIEGLWVALKYIHHNHFGEEYRQPVYEGEEIEKLINLAKSNGIKI
jgi:hypothetical protein